MLFSLHYQGNEGLPPGTPLCSPGASYFSLHLGIIVPFRFCWLTSYIIIFNTSVCILFSFQHIYS